MGNDQEIQQRVTRAALALDASGDGAWELPTVTRESLTDPALAAWYSPRFCELLGGTDVELRPVTESWSDAILPEDRERVQDARERRFSRQGNSTSVEYRVHTRQREVRWWQEVGRVQPGDRPGTLRMIGVVRDITEAKQERERLDRRLQLLEYTQAIERVGGWEVDLEDTSKDAWLDETYRIHELPIGTKVDVEEGINFYAPEHQATITAAVEGCMRGEPYAVELDIITAKGNRVSVHATGRPHFEGGKVVRMYGCFRDITETKRREAELRRQLALITRQQRAILDLSTPIIQLWDDIITLPLIGSIDPDRAAQIMDRLLDEVVRVGARFAILDLTGVDTVDTMTADQLFRITRAVDLLGARALFCGLTPPVAQSMTALGLDMAGFVTYRNLQEALQACLRTRGALVPTSPRRVLQEASNARRARE
ncbi:PAS domain-containing protein [Chondromyces crocatus]|uniref:Anti-anti-sigma factor n=1 Tax=Chondromyces crocatus TaxID=52 RepID=A0A0K1E6C8_CHOCO|nr:PAS domain-containing protein [Chondromyces crocatus]AKT36103.1 uncharacterized protein CMC5_002160 [Chondromyces crocatus]